MPPIKLGMGPPAEPLKVGDIVTWRATPTWLHRLLRIKPRLREYRISAVSSTIIELESP